MKKLNFWLGVLLAIVTISLTGTWLESTWPAFGFPLGVGMGLIWVISKYTDH